MEMTEIEQKALALLNEVNMERNRKGATFVFVDRSSCVLTEALCRAIEQHEAFKREVSDAVEAVFAGYHDAPIPWVVMRSKLEPFIIAKPDPLEKALEEAGYAVFPDDLKRLRAALAKRRLEVREIEG